MRKFVFLVLIAAVGLGLAGCSKKEQAIEDFGQPMTMETLTTGSTAPAMAPAPVEIKPQAAQPAAVEQAKLEPLPPQAPYKPTAIEIQTALKNAGLYTGEVDGKIGPKTKKAIADFQSANNLKADGKVGPKTWEALSKHLNAVPESPKKRR